MTILEKGHNFNNLLVAFIFVDILLLPYFNFFVMPLSLPVVLGVILLKKVKIKKDKEFIVFLTLSLLVLISVVLSFLQSPLYLEGMNVWIENIKRGFQLLTSFAYYIVLKNCIYSVNIKRILFSFVVFYIVLGIASFIDVATYFRLLEILGVRNPFVNEWYIRQNEYLFRYSYIWIDPNNAAYGFQMVAFYLLLNENLKPIQKIFIYSSIPIAIILSMSTGALISALVFFMLYILYKLKNTVKIKTSYEKMLKASFLFCFGFTLIAFIAYYFRDSYSYVREYSLDRMLDNTDGGRLSKYSFMFSDKLPNLIGEGYIQIRDGKFFRPHSDHLRFLYSYGIVAYFISLWFFFRRAIFNSSFLFVIPGFLAYSINSLIDEQKILIILLSLIAYTNHKVCKSVRNN
ncbi:hypothetical protein [Sporosarcina sp. HYO08]|uniref:hypothetical protein n=1 Tax=Sporosarcina sp. HYO08 TaxID=1759557 RepID=UPI00079BB8E4|nr:hypothetical protein [Sporosarcina sp. HYO08]KXH86864.1 hypothetical protein AU377_13590 [Sporosarcina sp. HYO08]